MTNKQEQTQYLMRLSIQVRLDGLSFFTQNDEGTVVDYAAFQFRKKVDPAGLLSEIQFIVKENPLLQSKYKNVSVIYVNNLFTLVPQALFDETKLTDYLKFNTKMLQTDFVTFDHIGTHEIVNVYIPYANVNNYFFDQYGAFTYHHALTHLITEVLDNAGHQEEAQILINIHPHSFEMIITEQKKLLFANTFEYQTKEDFIYYVLFTLEQLSLNPETVELELTGAIDPTDEKYNIAYTYIRNVQIKEAKTSQIPISDYLLSTLL
tara:strand:+ start:8690 stop:9481 length:792 start_codon:yes stop_codon:yes gene_type:complete